MNGLDTAELGKVAPISASSTSPTEDDVWLLNLDMVESNTGVVLDCQYVPVDSIGASTCRFDTGNVLYSKLRPYLNKVVLPDRDGYATSEMLPLRPDPSRLTREYLTYFLRSPQFVRHISAKVSGAKMPRVNTDALRRTRIPLPSLDEQRHIASGFDFICRAIDVQKEQIVQLDLLIESRFVEMFGDPMSNSFGLPIVELGSALTTEPQNGLYKPQSDYVTDGSGTPILRIDGFYDGKVSDFRSLKRLKCLESEKARYLLRENDIVINRVNSLEYLGKCALIRGLLEETVFESNMMRLHVDETVFDATFITQLLCSNYIHEQILKRAKKAVNQASINQKDVQSFRIYMPPLELQQKFSAFVSAVEKSKLVHNQIVEQMQLLYNERMSQYFGDFSA